MTATGARSASSSPPRGSSARTGNAGRTVVVGADAVGVACLSGPVLAAAVVMPPYGRRIPGVRDSKMLSRAQRERLYPQILRARWPSASARPAWPRSTASTSITPRTSPCAERSAACAEREHVLIDGLRVYRLEDSSGSYTAIVRGDAQLLLDRRRLDRGEGRPRPPHGPACGALSRTTAGSTTPATPRSTHRRGIEEQGITPFHRRSFARVRADRASASRWSSSCRRTNLDDALRRRSYAAAKRGVTDR